MRGRKPNQPSNVVPLTGARAPRPDAKALARKFCPRGLAAEERREWMRVAAILAAPELDRLKPHYVDAVLEYCRTTIRLRTIRQYFVDLNETKKKEREAEIATHTALPSSVACEHPIGAEVYEVETRSGLQLKSHPLVAQHNETWRQWRSLMMELGLSPSSERNLMPGQGDLFSDPASQYLD